MPIRLDKLVAERFGLSRRAAQEAVRNGRVDVAGDRGDEPGREVEPETPIAYFPNRPKARAVAGKLRVLHEDRHVLIVDKPAGLLTLPTLDHERDTLVERARRYLAIRHGGRRPFVGVVHRLDKGTSGALALAARPEPSAPSRRCSRRTTSSGSTWPSSRARRAEPRARSTCRW